MRIAVLGAHGQLGRDLVPRLVGEVQPLTRVEVDLDQPTTLGAYFDTHQPDVFVNCAAYNFVDKAETDPTAAFQSNAWGVRELARCCLRTGTRLVHVSTDYVFGLDTRRNTPFSENDAPGPVSVYGLSKLTGEYLVRTLCPNHLVIRTCGLYGVWGSGGKGGNFIETMLRLAREGKPLRVVADQHCTPTYTADLADVMARLIAQETTGLFHVTNDGATTWHDLAAEAFRLSGTSANLTPITTEQFAAPARRPSYSVLALDQLESLGVSRPRPWQQALAAYLTERQSRIR